MRRLLVFLISIFPVFSSGDALGQNPASDNLYLTVRKPLLFGYQNAEAMLKPLVLKDALELHIKVKQSACRVSASVQFSSAAALSAFAGKIILKQSSTTSSTAANNNTQVQLQSSPTPLFVQPAFGSSTSHYYFIYDLIVDPLTSFVSPGDHNFAIMFTMTDP